MTRVMLPSDADVYGVAHCGVLMSWIDICAGLSAKSHTNMPCVTASVDAVHFLRPVFVGDVVIVESTVNRCWRTSLEVGVIVVAEDSVSGEKRYCCHAYLTFVGLKDGKPEPVIPCIPQTDQEQEEFHGADIRRRNRFAAKELNDFNGGADDQQDKEVFDNHAPDESLFERFANVSYTQNTALIMPQHANSIGITFGGHIIKLMEDCALIAASRHTHRAHENSLVFRAVSIDSLSFLNATKVGDIVTVKAYVSRVWHSSIEVYITVHSKTLGYNDYAADTLFDQNTLKFTNDGYITFIAVGKNANIKTFDEDVGLQSPHIPNISGITRAKTLPKVVPMTKLEKWRFEKAEERKQTRLEEKRRLEERLRKNAL